MSTPTTPRSTGASTTAPTPATTDPRQPGELDIHLINEGRHEELWKVLGAHPTADGTTFPARSAVIPGSCR